MHVETERLELKPIAEGDLDELVALFREPGVRRYLLDDKEVEREWVEEVIATSRQRFADGSCGVWAARCRGGERIVGFSGYREFFEPPQLQLLYGLHPDLWGRGLASEMARTMIDLGFSRFALEEVVAATDDPNRASLRVMEKVGLRPWKRTGEGLRGTSYYRLLRSEWLPSYGQRLPEPALPRVLFVCTHNSARSQMAEALVRERWGDRLAASSAGTEPAEVHPLAIEVMTEVGIDLAGQASKSVDDLEGPFDFVVTVCEHAQEACPFVPATIASLHRSFADPSSAQGSEAERLQVFRRVRDEIAGWLEQTVPRWLELWTR